MVELSDLATFSPRPLEGLPTVFLVEERASWTGTRLLRLASTMARAMPGKPGELVAVCSASTAFVLAAALAAWSQSLELLILDPNLKTELDLLLGEHRGLAVLVDTPRAELAAAVHVAEDPEAEILAAQWPRGGCSLARFLTSGSTGEPKVVVKRPVQLFAQLAQELPWLGVDTGARVFAMVPPFHILGFVYGLLVPMLRSGSTAFLHGAAPAAWVDHIVSERPDAVIGVPSHYRFLVQSLEAPLPNALYLSSGAPLTADVNEAFRKLSGRDIVQIYGSTETGGVARRCGFGPWTPFPGLDWRVRPEDGRLMVSSSWQEDPESWTVTDDLARGDEGGGFILEGRTDSIVKVGGKRFSTNEILMVAEALPAVASAVTVSYERFGESAVALYVTATPAAGLGEAELRSALAARLAAFKVPRTIRVVESLPLLGNGKVDRRALARIAATEDGDAPD